jgi:hypothetical protein
LVLEQKQALENICAGWLAGWLFKVGCQETHLSLVTRPLILHLYKIRDKQKLSRFK